ncbi:MAG TPA: hypothetical protein VM889_07565 [Candidatus Thermoplasmatota archaeon]|nr:hypothetical protein [Candidatus Thermoplasmatota archaeon]
MVRVRLIARVLAVSLLVVVVPAAVAGHARVAFEAGENGRAALDASGQRNCIPEAISGATGPCPWGANGAMRVLDSVVFATFPTGAHAPGEPPSSGLPIGWASSSAGQQYNDNVHRGSGGTVADVILPGSSTFRAWYGWWWDNNTNGVIDLAVRIDPEGRDEFAKTNEFRMIASTAATSMQGYVSPGAHPPVTSSQRPGDVEPDFGYSAFTNDARQMWNQGNGGNLQGSVFLDGSLLETFVVETVTHPILVPGFTPDGVAKPYTTTASSLVDIDRYAALAPGPLAGVYQGTGASALVRSVDGPGLSLCPENCVVPPFPVAAGPVAGLAFARYGQETDEDAGSSASGRLADYRARYAGWLDVVFGLAVPESLAAGTYRQTPLLALGAGGAGAVPPGGSLAFEMWTGAWRDLDEDGYIGAAGGDPYEGGNRPVPDRYRSSGSEFVAHNGIPPTENLYPNVTLVPEEGSSWGEAGVILLDRGTIGALTLLNSGLCAARPSSACGPAYLHGPRYVGREPITIDASTQGGAVGFRASTHILVFPEGSVGNIVACSSAWVVRTAEGDETVHDCDRIAALR